LTSNRKSNLSVANFLSGNSEGGLIASLKAPHHSWKDPGSCKNRQTIPELMMGEKPFVLTTSHPLVPMKSELRFQNELSSLA